jgi:ribosomal protein S14
MSPLDKSVPYIVQLEFNDAGGGVREPTPRTITRVKIEDDAVEIKVGMLHHHGLGFNVLKQDQKTKVWVPNGSYYCVLMAPNQDDRNQLWKAVPVGLCQASVLGPYNEIQRRNLRPIIPQLVHTLDSLGTMRVEFTPTHWNERKYPRYVRGKKTEQVYFHIGYEGGRIVLLDSASNTPPFKRDATDPTKIAVNEEDGSLAFHKSIFRVTVTENSYVYFWLGKKGDIVTDGLVPVIEAAEQLDPYRALGQSKSELDPDNIDGRRRALLATLHLPSNAFRQYALGLGVITNKAGDDVVRAVAEKLLAEAATQAAEDMAAEWRALTVGFMTSSAFLDMRDILDGLEDTPENRNKVRGRRQDPEGGRDFLAVHIEKIACRTEEGEGFNWKSPIQRKLRRWIFDEVVKLLVPPPTPAP